MQEHTVGIPTRSHLDDGVSVSVPRTRSAAVVSVVLASLLIALAAYAFRNQGMQSISWSYPYYSGAANFQQPFDWRISPTDYETVVRLSPEALRRYRHADTGETVLNTVNEYGYVLVALIARTLLPWLGDIQAVVLLQTLVHIAMCLLVAGYLLESRLQRVLFFALYAVNPLVLHFVTFPFYYFWTAVPSVVFAAAWLKPNVVRRWLPLLVVVLLFSLLIRLTTLFLAVAAFGVLFWRSTTARQRRACLYSLAAFLIGVVLIQRQGVARAPFHTMYIGIGAYPNPYDVAAPRDEEGFRAFQSLTGVAISTHPIVGNWRDAHLRGRYNDSLKERYTTIVRASPLLVARNAALNTIQAFGIGYDADRPWSRPVTIAAGLAMIALLIAARQWIWGAGILAYAAGFALYFPPIPAYLFGAYMLTALGTSAALQRVAVALRGARPQSAS